MATGDASITMSMREADRLKVVKLAVDRMTTVGKGADRLGTPPETNSNTWHTDEEKLARQMRQAFPLQR